MSTAAYVIVTLWLCIVAFCVVGVTETVCGMIKTTRMIALDDARADRETWRQLQREQLAASVRGNRDIANIIRGDRDE